MSRSAVKDGQPFSAERKAQLLADFRRDGFCVIGGVPDADDHAALREATDRYMADSAAMAGGYVERDHILRHVNELAPIFLDLLRYERPQALTEEPPGFTPWFQCQCRWACRCPVAGQPD